MPLETAREPTFGNMAHPVNKLMDQLQRGFFSICRGEAWTPTVNLYESETAYLVCVDLAGVDKDKIEVVVADNQLKLKGQRAVPAPPTDTPEETPCERLRVHMMEIDHGPFCREVELPQDVARDKIAAIYRNGMLWVELPKK